MVRRDFLKVSGVFSAALLIGLGPVAKMVAQPVEVELHGKAYRGTSDGTIYISEDDGKTWSVHTRFGSHLSVVHLYVDFQRRVVAVLKCQGYDFRVSLSPNSRMWRTA